VWEDPIVAEVRRARDEYAARFNYDLDAIYRDLKEKERNSGIPVVSFPPRRIAPVDADTDVDRVEPRSGQLAGGNAGQ
jgi:hypothetical protein